MCSLRSRGAGEPTIASGRVADTRTSKGLPGLTWGRAAARTKARQNTTDMDTQEMSIKAMQE